VTNFIPTTFLEVTVDATIQTSQDSYLLVRLLFNLCYLCQLFWTQTSTPTCLLWTPFDAKDMFED